MLRLDGRGAVHAGHGLRQADHGLELAHGDAPGRAVGPGVALAEGFVLVDEEQRCFLQKEKKKENKITQILV